MIYLVGFVYNVTICLQCYDLFTMLRFVYHLEEHELLLLDVFDCEETISPKFILDSAAEGALEIMSDKCILAEEPEGAWEIES